MNTAKAKVGAQANFFIARYSHTFNSSSSVISVSSVVNYSA
jgi:hypothetical protein